MSKINSQCNKFKVSSNLGDGILLEGVEEMGNPPSQSYPSLVPISSTPQVSTSCSSFSLALPAARWQDLSHRTEVGLLNI